MGKLSIDGGGRAAGARTSSRVGSRGGCRRISSRGVGLATNPASSLSTADEKSLVRRFSRQVIIKAPHLMASSGNEEKHHLRVVKGLFKPYQGDLFGNSGKDNTQGMLYLSRMDPSRDPKNTRLEMSEELKRRSLTQLGVKEGDGVVAEKEAHRAAGEERRRRLAISLATLSKKPDKRGDVVEHGGVAALAKLSRSEETRTRSSCAQVFNSLATEKDLRQRMMEQGAVPAIIALAASSHNRLLRTECMEALCKLAVLPGSEAQIIAEGGVACLLAVQRAVPVLGEVCLKTLINLSCSPGPLDLKADELNDAALQLASTVEEDEFLEMLLIQLLCNLSGFKNNQQKLVEEGAIRIIARAAERTTSVDVVRLCASTLCNFAGDGRARPKMSDSRTAQALLDLTRHEDLGVRREVAHTVARLAADASCREKILQYGIIPILVTMSAATNLDTTTGRYIALAFRVLSSDIKFAEIIVDGGAVDALISLTRSADKPCRLSCAQSLCNLIRFAIRLDYLIECGVVSALVRLADPGDEATSECCAAALYLFFCHPAVLALIDGREVIRALLDLCRVGRTSIRKRCVAAIWNMTNVEQVAQGGGSAAESIPMLLGLLQTESDRELKADCAAALYNLARNQANCQAMIVSGAVLPIIVLANSGSFETKTQCMSILQRMLLGRAMPEEIMTKSFVRTLLDMSKMEHRDTQQRVVIAVYRISCCKRGRELLLEEGAPESLIRLMSKPNEEMRKGCANTLLNLASDPGREIEITRCGAVSVLLITALVASDSDETRHACTKAITNLLCEKQAHRGMYKDGVVWGLATMSRSKDLTISRLCSAALCNLSCEYWKEIATSNCMQALYALARSDDEAVMAAGTKALHNVLLRAQHLDLDHIFSRTVPLALRALEHSSKDIRLVGLRLTHLVSTTAVSRQTAMRYGLLERINVNDFDSDEPLCHAFCCALDKFALDPATRSSVLDSGCITNFPVLCAVSTRIFARLAQFIYSVSCSPEHVPRLVFEHDCVKVVAAVLEPNERDETGSLAGARETCAALLFNLSTQDEVKTELVLKGGTRLAFALWEEASPEARRNCSLVACNLAVGKVNTAKMVRHGAGQLLVELVANTDPYKDADVRKRASAAFRNLLCVSGNHVQLAQEEVIPALLDLAKTECPVVRRNCASAMRSMTCKKDVRQLLIASGAIKVILDDAKNQDADENLAIDNDLLCEIEAESWVNGTRGILVESRASPLPGLEQNCSLLPATMDKRGGKTGKITATAAVLKEEGEDMLYNMPWQKLQALDVTLREPDMEVSMKQESAKRFDDPGVAAALVGDTDLDGPGGLLSSIRPKCGKLEPKNIKKTGVLQRPEKEDEGGNPYTEGADSSSPAENSTSSKEASSSISRVGRQLASLECTIEESSETDNSNESAEFDESDDLNESEGGQKRKFGPRISIETDSGSVSTSSSSTVGDGGGGNMGERVTGGKNRAGCGRQRGDVETMREPPMVDWEVAVVMSSKNADDMVERYIQTRKEIHPGRRGSVLISSLSTQRRSSAIHSHGAISATGSGDINSATASSVNNSRRGTVALPRRVSIQSGGALPRGVSLQSGGAFPRRVSVQSVGRRPSALARQIQAEFPSPGTTSGSLQNILGRRLSVPNDSKDPGGGVKMTVPPRPASSIAFPLTVADFPDLVEGTEVS